MADAKRHHADPAPDHAPGAPGADEDNPKTHPESNAEKDPHDWTTGGEPMTGAQASYLKTLCEETGEEFDPNLTKSEASLMIDRLKGESPRLKGD